MNEYKLNVQPGKVVKETYTKTYTEIVEHQPPSVEGQFVAPYVAKIDVPLGEEKMIVDIHNGKFRVKTVKYDSSKSQRLLNLGKVVGKIVSSEVKSIFGKGTQIGLTYTGLPAEADEAVNKARDNYELALGKYLDARDVPEQKTVVTKRQTLNITPTAVNIDTETLDNKL
jgi:hypothetical protein